MSAKPAIRSPQIKVNQATIEALLGRVTYKRDFEFCVLSDGPVAGPMIRASMRVEDSRRPSTFGSVQSTTTLPLAFTDEYSFFSWFANWLIQLEKHESQEWFKVDGELFVDPHAEGRF